MTDRSVLSAIGASLLTGLTVPLLFIAAEAAVQGDGLGTDDLGFAYTVVAPFALVIAFAVAWPSYRLQADRHPLWRRIAVAAIISGVAGTAALIPLADEFPWKAGATAVATLVVWTGAYHFLRDIFPKTQTYRSEPSG